VQIIIVCLVQQEITLPQSIVMGAPCRYRIPCIHTRRGKDRIPQLRHRLILRLAGEHRSSPRRRRRGHDRPVDRVPRDQLHRGPACFREGAIRAPHFLRVFFGQQSGISAGNGHARSIIAKGLRDAILKQGRGSIEALMR
jgi:hypothetical protein